MLSTLLPLQLLLLLLLCCTVSHANVAPFPGVIEEVQPDGSIAPIYLKGHPRHGIFQTDEAGHIALRNEEGWYVYAVPVNTTDDGEASFHYGNRRRLQPSGNVVGKDAPPQTKPLNLHEFTLLPPPPPKKLVMGDSTSHKDDLGSRPSDQSTLWELNNDVLCDGMERSQWCPNNPLESSALQRSVVTTDRIGGKLNLLVVLVKFSDQASRPVADKSEFERLFNDDTYNPTGSVKKFFQVNSGKLLTVQAHVEDWIVADGTEQDFSFGRHGQTIMFANVANTVLDRMDARGGMNWSDFDRDQVSILNKGLCPTLL